MLVRPSWPVPPAVPDKPVPPAPALKVLHVTLQGHWADTGQAWRDLDGLRITGERKRTGMEKEPVVPL